MRKAFLAVLWVACVHSFTLRFVDEPLEYQRRLGDPDVCDDYYMYESTTDSCDSVPACHERRRQLPGVVCHEDVEAAAHSEEWRVLILRSASSARCLAGGASVE